MNCIHYSMLHTARKQRHFVFVQCAIHSHVLLYPSYNRDQQPPRHHAQHMRMVNTIAWKQGDWASPITSCAGNLWAGPRVYAFSFKNCILNYLSLYFYIYPEMLKIIKEKENISFGIEKIMLPGTGF